MGRQYINIKPRNLNPNNDTIKKRRAFVLQSLRCLSVL